jgi:diphthine synthase
MVALFLFSPIIKFALPARVCARVGYACVLICLRDLDMYLTVMKFCRATTHTDLVVRARDIGVEVKVIHNASVMNAVGICGLQLYRYGETISIPFFTETWRPDSFYEKIQNSRRLGLHTLCLLGS